MFALIALALFWHGDLNAVVLAVAIVIGLCEAVSEPALLVIAPRILPGKDPASGTRSEEDEEAEEHRITAAYGLLEGMRNTSGIVGPTLAAALIALLSPSAGALAAAVTFGLSAAATRWAGGRYAAQSAAPEAGKSTEGSQELAGGQTGEPAGELAGPEQRKEAEEQEPEEPLLRSALGGLAVLWRVRWLRYVQLLAVVHVLFAVGPWMVALPVLIIERGHSATVYALVLGSFAAGTVLGAFLGGRIRGSRRGLYALGLLGLFGLTALAPVLTESVLLLTAAFVVGGIGQQAFDVVKMAGLRREVPDRLHGRAFSADFFFSFASLPLGQLLGAALLRFLDAESIMLWAGVLVLVTTALTMLSPDTRRFGSAQRKPQTQTQTQSAEAISAERAEDVRTR
ncbi:MFS transporter [Streptomyces sp. NBC_00190]|uniref:MFS transporter n=1 Tax=Streptomyces sp. NBC_00190 TaxID=2903634 RepID=UPI002E2D5CF7|nr:MFS transporter [Streptomyces sp. NBC_00190]